MKVKTEAASELVDRRRSAELELQQLLQDPRTGLPAAGSRKSGAAPPKVLCNCKGKQGIFGESGGPLTFGVYVMIDLPKMRRFREITAPKVADLHKGGDCILFTEALYLNDTTCQLRNLLGN
ncbi:hypothetical protein TcasGA2_TC012767 [Tribolium castaneum]|uniref:Uncharacterized protein n=1 Tax=Tribolium castaneum TaxID=7070 RepID=D6X0A5_TRICA|nr:hypothetical protein TcasGA2_TC012767 [Tribolium castaneum]